VHQRPEAYGIERSRWTLDDIHQVCDWLRLDSLGGLSRLLKRLGLSWKRARDYIHSPDPDYLEKLAEIAVFIDRARTSHGSIALLYLDELTFYRQPTLFQAYEERGHLQPLARRSQRTNTATRVVAALNVMDGRVHYRRGSKIGLRELVAFYREIRQAYAEAERIYVVQDNNPMHFHPDVLVALEKQENHWPLYKPPNWCSEASAKASRQWGQLQLPIQLVPLPTYAPWTNPVEKLWRKLKQEYLHLHRLADRLDELRGGVDRFLDQFANGSLALLHYVGILVPG
jgi:hypothetical protein